MHTAVERITESKIIEGILFIKWHWKEKSFTDSNPNLLIDWSVPLRERNYYFVWLDKLALNESVFMRAPVEDNMTREIAKLNLGGLRETSQLRPWDMKVKIRILIWQVLTTRGLCYILFG